MKELYYKSIVERLWTHGTDTLNEWVQSFPEDLMFKYKTNNYSEKQKETILKINNKFLKRNNIN